MSLISRHDAGLKSARSPSDVEIAPGEHPLASFPSAAAESARHRFVVGIFDRPTGAYAAAKDLAPNASDVLVVLGSAPGEAKATTVTDGRVIVHHLDTSDALATNLAAALNTFAAFAALGRRASEPHGEASIPPGLLQRLFQNLVHHLAAGAAVVIVHAPDSERQLRISRGLLEAKCDILLTHDVVQAAISASPEPAAADACCENCTSRSCRRIDAHHNGKAHAKE
jgi:hypothetical protein